MNGIAGFFVWCRAVLFGRAAVAVEILALQQQLAVLKRQVKHFNVTLRSLLSPRWVDCTTSTGASPNHTANSLPAVASLKNLRSPIRDCARRYQIVAVS